MKLDVKSPSADALDAVKAKANRVCPLVCEHGFRADGDRCSKISCPAGSFVNNDDACEKKRERPIAKREEQPGKRERSEPPKVEPDRPKAQASGQIICDGGGCRPTKQGCRIREKTAQERINTGVAGLIEVCN